ncbi:hypothetical protein ACFVQ4_20390 [Streptomyces laurentii]|uniref:hypothetical protein n=1 Tax=Streptomyces laurentii TaxID=39478 RepID=UPI0036BAFE4D
MSRGYGKRAGPASGRYAGAPAASPLLDGVACLYFEDNQEARVVRGNEGRPGGVAAHALDPAAADRLREYASDAPRAMA